MAVKSLDSKLREKWFAVLCEMLANAGEEVIKYKSNEMCIPVLDEDGNEKWVQFVVKVPKGSRDGDEFDGYSMRQEYEIKQKAKVEKAKADAEKKAKKMERDRQMREAKKKAKKEE